jgi:hypothetical protein
MCVGSPVVRDGCDAVRSLLSGGMIAHDKSPCDIEQADVSIEEEAGREQSDGAENRCGKIPYALLS